MRYSVPQFIDIEDKLFGSLTFKQILYIIGSIGAAFVIFNIIGGIIPNIPFMVLLILSTPPVALGLALAFIKINKRPFSFFLESLFFYHIKKKKYVWKKREVNQKDVIRKSKKIEDTIIIKDNEIPKFSQSKLRKLAWNLDMDLENN